ncbi:hypothetical protein BSNK01_00660 [Bacillaceae bacterium]
MRRRSWSSEEIDDKTLLLNLYLTQIIVLVLCAAGIYFWFVKQGRNFFAYFVPEHFLLEAALGCAAALLIILAEILFFFKLPRRYFDDGGINEKLFSRRSVSHIFFIALLVAVGEETLFRGVLQSQFGLWWTSLLFTLVHTRYLKSWVLILAVFLISMLFGWLADVTGHLIAPILAHFLVDFVLGVLVQRKVFTRVTTKDGGERSR